ncbi:MAG: hypothetical protein N3A68_06880 [Bacteroidia bacterium]|nr:hypothetical protein [Bacteroidia bacterium]GIV23365.1 MAG: 3-deoxy-D-manno-octulosonic acid transferase [Bacteroidia bacterium]
MKIWLPIYTLFWVLLSGFIPIIAFFSPKVRAWWRARRTPPPILPVDRAVLWMHCASVGEFEQGRPVLEYFIQQLPHKPYIVVTFFSPSGWQRYQQSYPLADWLGPAPLDLPWQVKQWIQAIHPTAVFFVKYDLWPNILYELHRRSCPTYLLAAHVEPLRGLRWWWRRQLLPYLNHIFVQTPADQVRLSTEGFIRVTMAGDSRLIRVRQLVENWLPVSGIAEWIGDHFCIIAGSIWEPDARFLAKAYEHLRGFQIRWILVPHEVNPRSIETLHRLWPVRCATYTRPEWPSERDTLIIDTLGLLAYLYSYGHVAWVGGGFGKGIHNILEAVAYKKPVFFGPNFQDFPEAKELIKSGVAETCRYPVSFANSVKSLIKDRRRLQIIAEKAEAYLSNKPDTPRIVWELLQKEAWVQRLLQPDRPGTPLG